MPIIPKQATAVSDRALDIPHSICFADLKLRLLRGDIVSFKYEVFRQAWIACGYPLAPFYSSNKMEVFTFIARWYAEYERFSGRGSAELEELIDYLLSEKASTVRILPT